jgi:hypothetical protein
MTMEHEVVEPPKRVAVIAVHGVGYTAPGATAKHLSDLLLGLGRLKLDEQTDWPDAVPPYEAFEQTPLVVPLKRPYLHPADRDLAGFRVARKSGRTLLHAFDERLGYLARAFSKDIAPEDVVKQVQADHGKIAQEFMRVQLAGYVSQDEGQAYDTACLEAERREAGKANVTVHVYESYWADLSHPKNNILSFFLAFYQLVFHLSSLSRTAVYYAALEHMTDWRWRVVSFLQAFASRVLVLPIPILNLILLLTGLSVLPLKLSSDTQRPVAATIAGLLSLVVILLLRRLWGVPSKPWQWLTLLLLAAAVGAASGYWLADGDTRTGAVLAIEWWIFGGALLFELLERYNRVRRRALATGLVLLICCFVAFCYCLHAAWYPKAEVEQASLWTIQLIMGALVICWVALLTSALLLWLFNGICLYWQIDDKPSARAEKEGQAAEQNEEQRKKQEEEKRAVRGRARAALRTGRLTLAVSASTFLLVTIFLWSGIFRFGTSNWKLYSSVPPTPPPLGDTFGKAFSYLVPEPTVAQDWVRRVHYAPYDSKNPTLITDFVWALLLVGVTSGVPVMLALSLPALIILAWTILPSLLLPRSKLNKFGNRLTNALGNWYSRGLDSTTVVAALLWHSIFTVVAIFGLLDFIYCYNLGAALPGWLWVVAQWTSLHTLQMLYVAAGSLAVSGAAVAALALKYGKVPLDIILDVDNYLRTSPLDATPRARIVERYVSLLRHVARRSDQHGKPYYTSIVIAAHSLGALISVDLLHFLRREGDPDLQRLGFWPAKSPKSPEIPISLLTFGNPIRQLLNRFFPHLYWWINPSPDNSRGPLPKGADTTDKVQSTTTPKLKEIQLRSWVNAYRSGDFVGRSVWLDNWYRRNDAAGDAGAYPEVAHEFSPVQNALELCIGAGGHNDYWNRSAPDIARQLDALIAR